MEQRKISRENFWKNEGVATEEMNNYLMLIVEKQDSVITTTYEWFTLLCC